MMMRFIDCRVCNQSVGVWDWKSHVEDHKRKFLKDTGKNLSVGAVSWESVVKYYNPKRCKLSADEIKLMNTLEKQRPLTLWQ